VTLWGDFIEHRDVGSSSREIVTLSFFVALLLELLLELLGGALPPPQPDTSDNTNTAAKRIDKIFFIFPLLIF